MMNNVSSHSHSHPTTSHTNSSTIQPQYHHQQYSFSQQQQQRKDYPSLLPVLLQKPPTMLMGHRGYCSTNPQVLKSSKSRTLEFISQGDKQQCISCNIIYDHPLRSISCGHRICNECFNKRSNLNGYIPPEKCPLCLMIVRTSNLTTLLSNHHIRDAFHSQNVSPKEQPPSSPHPINSNFFSQSSNSKISSNVWEPLTFENAADPPISDTASRTLPLTSPETYKVETFFTTAEKHSPNFWKTSASSTSSGHFLTPLGQKSLQFKSRDNNNSDVLSKAMCTNCDEKNNAVTGYCIDCKEYLCAECIMAHARVKMTKDHKIHVIDNSFTSSFLPATSTSTYYSDSASFKEDSESPSSIITGNAFSSVTSCPEHDSFFVSWCITCGNLNLCLRCLPNHSGHQLRIIPVYEGQASLRRLITESRTVQKSLELSKESIKNMHEKIDVSIQSVVEEIQSVVQLYINALEERKRDLLQLTENIHQTKLAILNQQNEKINEKMKAIEGMIKYAEQLCLDSASSSVIGLSPYEEDPRYFDCYEKLIKLHSDGFISFFPKANDTIKLRDIDPHLLRAIQCMGHIESGLCPKASRILGTKYKRAIMGRPCLVKIQMKDVCGDPLSRDAREQALTSILYGPLSDEHALVYHPELIDRESGVCALVFTPPRAGIYRLSIRYNQIHITGSPTDITVCPGRDYKDAQIRGQKFSFGKEGSGDGEFSRPWGICCDLKGRILVADRSNHRIQIFDGRGNFLLKFGVRGNRFGEFNRPAGITTNPNNDIIIADKDNHRIQIFYENGGFSHAFGSRGFSPGLFSYPWDVACNYNYEIAVTDTRNHRIQIFNARGNLLKICTIDGEIKRSPSSPRGICFSSDNELIVSDFNTHRLAVVNSNGEPRFFGLEGTAPGYFHRPQGLAVDAQGLVLVCDSRSNRIQVLNIYDLTVVALIGNDIKHQRPDMIEKCQEIGTSIFQHSETSQVNTPNANLLEHPMDVCVSPEGLVYAVDFGSCCIRVY